jgi:hypothetical protein
MHIRQTFILATLRAIQGLLDDNKHTVAPVNDSGARKTLDSLIQQLSTQAVDQDAGRVTSRGETSLQASLREALRQFHMKPIAEIARSRLRDVPEMVSFRLPRGTTPSLQLVAKAGGMADAAAKHSAVFIDRGLPQDFIAQLTAAADALNRSLDTRAKSHGRSTGATNALSALASEALACIRELNALVTPKLGRDDRLLGEWRTAKRVRRKSGPTLGRNTPSPEPESPPTRAASLEKPAA